MATPTSTPAGPGSLEEALDVVCSTYWVPAPRALAAARYLADAGERDDDPVLRGTALVAEGLVAVRRGELERAFDALEAAQRESELAHAPQLAALLAGARSRLSFFSGAYHAALAYSDEALALAEGQPLGPLQLDVRFVRTLVLDNVLPGRLDPAVDGLVETAERLGGAAALAVAHNDVACILLKAGRHDEANREAELAVEAAEAVGADDGLVRSFAYSTRGEIRLAAGDPRGALTDLETALENPSLADEPYLSAMIAHIAAQALSASGRPGEALETARRSLDALGERLPHARALLLRQIAECLRADGRHREAYAALEAASELERSTALELSLRHHELQQAALEAGAARRHADDLQELVTQLEQAHAERARLLARTVEAAEDERIRVAIELHDGPIQRLTVVALSLDRLVLMVEKGELERVPAKVVEIRDLLASEMVALRRLMTELRPPVIDERGLHAALADCARQVLADSGAQLELRWGLGDARLAREVETVLYRVVREALVNAVKHGAAARVEVAVEPAEDGLVRLLVADDGRGFSEDEVRDRAGGHYGLLGMRERVESLAGRFDVRSAPAEGTQIEAVLPPKPAS